MSIQALPPALSPFYTCARTNESIILFRGRVDIAGGTIIERCRGAVVLDWLPSPTVNCRVWGPISALAMDSIMGTAQVEPRPRVPRLRVPRQFNTLRRTRASQTSSSFESSTGLRNLECGCGDASFAYALLHVANLPLFTGRPISWPDGSAAAARLLFEGGGWTVVLDHVRNAGAVEKELQSHGGFALTHTARVQRASGEAFTRAELMPLTEAFTYFCWLCAESKCGPMLPVGFDAHDRAAWSHWDAPSLESFPVTATWLDTVNAGEAETLFPTFMARFQDAYWRQVLKHGIHYMIEAGRPQTLERAIVMAQVLLEGVSYSWLVKEVKTRTHDAFEKRTAAQNIRAMLRSMSIPTAVPKSLAALAGTRDRKGHLADGPEALTLRRNEVIHRREATAATDNAALVDAWVLGAWYAELVLLRLCGFNGLYRSRLSENRWTGSVEKAPWLQ